MIDFNASNFSEFKKLNDVTSVVALKILTTELKRLKSKIET